MHFQPEAAGSGGAALELKHPFRGAGQVQTSAFLPAGGQAGFRFELFVQADTVLQHAGNVPFGTQLSHQAGRMPGRTTG